MLSNIKIGIAVGTLVFAALAVTQPELESSQEKTRVRVPKSIDQASPPCLQVYKYIKQYADSFDIPVRYAFGVANAETSYKGPFHWKYDPTQSSGAGAVGPMQVMVSTARYINKDNCSREKLMTDIEYNIYTSMKLLRRLYNLRKDWKIVFGEYNTGRPCVNGYSHKVTSYDFDWKTEI
jgi:soluble lytic murein transglycosylase-like protein